MAELENQKKQLVINKDLRPAYYDDFHCLAAGCRLSCCRGWGIPFDKKDYLSLKRQKGSPELNARMEGALRRLRKGPLAEKFYGEFVMDGGVCPLLREDCLCSLQAEKGHEVLPLVCRSYPRAEEYAASGCLQRSLGVSCEGVLALLWDLPDGIAFRSDPLPRDQQKIAMLTPFQTYFALVQEWCIDLLQDRRFTLPQRIWLMGLGLKELAEGETDIQRWMRRAAALPEVVDVSGILPTGNQELRMFLSNCVQILRAFKSTDPTLRTVNSDLLESMRLKVTANGSNLDIPLEPYQEARERYAERFGERDYFMENVMVSIFFYCQIPNMDSTAELWKDYVNFCNLYALYRFLSVMSCRDAAAGDRDELFKMIVYASRELLHDRGSQSAIRDGYFKNGSATLAHMAILLSG